MPEIADVIASEVIEDGWGNAIRDRTVQRYDDESTRTSESPSPNDGDLSFLEDTGDLSVYFGGSWRNFVPTGSVLPFAGGSAPAGWLICNGAAISRTTYARLFTIIGTAFGAGDGSTTFNIPDMRQRFPLGMAASGTGATRGSSGGNIDHTHTGPSHTHSMGTHVHVGPSHTHTEGTLVIGNTDGAHTHTFSDSFTTGNNVGADSAASGPIGLADNPHTHSGSVSGTTSSAGTHGHGIDGSTGSAGSGNTSATDPGDTNAGGTGATGAANPPFLAMPFIIKT